MGSDGTNISPFSQTKFQICKFTWKINVFCHYCRYHFIIGLPFDDTWAIFICHTEQYILWRFKWHFFAIIIVNIIIFYVLKIQYSGGNISEKKLYCWVILDVHNMSQLQINASQWPQNNWFWRNRLNAKAQGIEVTIRQNIMIQLFYVINNMFRDMNSGCGISIEGCVFI